MLDVHIPTHTQGVIPTSTPAVPTDTDMTEASTPVLTHGTSLSATLHPELVLPRGTRMQSVKYAA